MNPTDVAQSVLPLTSSDLSIWGLFWSAHIVVKAVMIGLLVASIWVWAIVIDKLILYARTKRAMDRFEKTFWSGQSLEELYRTQSAGRASMAALFVPPCVSGSARSRAQPRHRRPADAHREGYGRHHRARDRAARAPPAGARPSARGPFIGLSAGVGS